MAYSTSPIVGIDLGGIVQSDAPEKDFTKLGLRVVGDDAHDYILAVADGAIAASTAAIGLTEAGMKMKAATGGQWTSPAVALASGDLAWFKKTAIDAIA